jgi:EAL domain-containing protein (putative c-di-GMP-specific phosphodiesterase class I)/FixJ family two-component response regulator
VFVGREGVMLRRFADARVMAIDDNVANIALLRALLERAGLHHLATFTDPREAVALLSQFEPDLVLLDLHMPHLDGFDVLDQVVRYAAGAYLPVLVLSADSTKEAIHRALELGANDFLTKPYDAIEVTLRVRNLLETRQLYETVRGHNRQLHDQLDVYHALERSEHDNWRDERERIEAIINDHTMSMVFQPIFDLAEGQFVGVEALARFPDTSLGPDRWFARAASVGLGPALETAAIREALKVAAVLPESAFVALNVSPGAMLSTSFQELCSDEFCRRVVLELTEHVPVEDYDAVALALAAFRAKGMKLAADDTGAGYAGFRHLLSLDPDIIKLDISLIRDIHLDPARRALATSLVSFAADTDRTLVAEGIESAEELDTVRELSVRWGQGYHLARPMTSDALGVLLART